MTVNLLTFRRASPGHIAALVAHEFERVHKIFAPPGLDNEGVYRALEKIGHRIEIRMLIEGADKLTL